MIVLMIAIVCLVLAGGGYYVSGPHELSSRRRRLHVQNQRRLTCQRHTRDLEKLLFPGNPLFEKPCFWWDPNNGEEISYLYETEHSEISPAQAGRAYAFGVPYSLANGAIGRAMTSADGERWRSSRRTPLELAEIWSAQDCCRRYPQAHWSDESPPEWHLARGEDCSHCPDVPGALPRATCPECRAKKPRVVDRPVASLFKRTTMSKGPG